MTRTIPTFLIVMAGFRLVASGGAQTWGDFVTGNSRVQGAVIPVYLGTASDPALVVRADKIYRDYQRKGFFRIGVLPIAVMEGVTFEVRHVELVTNRLARLEHWIDPRASRRLELRQATIRMAGTVTNELRADRIHIVPGGTWALVDDVRLQLGTNEVRAARATCKGCSWGVVAHPLYKRGQFGMSVFARLALRRMGAAANSPLPPEASCCRKRPCRTGTSLPVSSHGVDSTSPATKKARRKSSSIICLRRLDTRAGSRPLAPRSKCV